VIITGASGFIGSALAEKLLLNGVRVYGVGRNKKKLDMLKQYGDFIPVEADFKQYGTLHELIDERGFDMLWHFAWIGTVASASTFNDYSVQNWNIKSTCDVALSAVKLKCDCISFSGSYYQKCSVKFDKHQFNPAAYGAAKKYAAELFMGIANQNNMSCVNIILPHISGCSAKSNMAILFFVKRMLANEPLNLIKGNNYDDWVYIDDIIEGIICTTKSKKKFVEYYIGNRELTTFKEKITYMKSLLASESTLLFDTYTEEYIVDYDQIDIGALYRDTGWETKVSFEESIAKIVDIIND